MGGREGGAHPWLSLGGAGVRLNKQNYCTELVPRPGTNKVFPHPYTPLNPQKYKMKNEIEYSAL